MHNSPTFLPLTVEPFGPGSMAFGMKRFTCKTCSNGTIDTCTFMWNLKPELNVAAVKGQCPSVHASTANRPERRAKHSRERKPAHVRQISAYRFHETMAGRLLGASGLGNRSNTESPVITCLWTPVSLKQEKSFLQGAAVSFLYMLAHWQSSPGKGRAEKASFLHQ